MDFGTEYYTSQFQKSVLYQWTAKAGGQRYGTYFAFTITWWLALAWTIGRALNILNFALLIIELPSWKEISTGMVVDRFTCNQWFHFEVLLSILETLLALPRTKTMRVLFASAIAVWIGMRVKASGYDIVGNKLPTV